MQLLDLLPVAVVRGKRPLFSCRSSTGHLAQNLAMRLMIKSHKMVHAMLGP